jgi:hypothetical protein
MWTEHIRKILAMHFWGITMNNWMHFWGKILAMHFWGKILSLQHLLPK